MEKLLIKPIYLLKKFFVLQGIDFPRMMAIVETKLLMDKRRVYMNWGKSGGNESSAHLRNILLFYALMGSLMGLFMFVIPSLVISMVIVHSYLIFMMAMTLITDFSSVLLDTNDNQILLPRPINSRTYFMARLVHIIIYLLQFLLALSLIPVLVAAYKFSALVGIAMLFTMILTGLLALFLTYLLYMLIIRFSSGERVKEIVTYSQIFMTVFFAAAYQVIPRLIDFENMTYDFEFYGYSYLLPPVWMAMTLDMIHTSSYDLFHILMAILAVCFPVAASWFLLRFLAPSFAARLSSIASETSYKSAQVQKRLPDFSISSFIGNLVCNSEPEKAAFSFTWKMTSRDKSFRLKLYPSLGYIIVFIFIIFFQRGQTLTETLHDLPGSNSFLWLIYIPMFTISGSIVFMTFYDNYPASWVYQAVPLERPGEIISGAVKSIFIKYFIPLYLVMFCLALPVWGATVADDFIFGFFNTLANYFILASVLQKFLPFTRQPNVQQQSGRFIAAILQFVMIGLMVGIHYIVLNISFLYYILLPLFILVYWLMVRFLRGLGWEKINI